MVQAPKFMYEKKKKMYFETHSAHLYDGHDPNPCIYVWGSPHPTPYPLHPFHPKTTPDTDILPQRGEPAQRTGLSWRFVK